MPSLDITSAPNGPEVQNGVDNAMREINNRYDFRDANCTIEIEEGKDGIAALIVQAADDYKVGAAVDVLREKMSKRGIDFRFFDLGKVEVAPSGHARQTLAVKAGIDREFGKKIQKTIKDQKLKVQVEIRGDELRVSGKKRDDLQTVMALLKEAGFDQPLSFGNFRD